MQGNTPDHCDQVNLARLIQLARKRFVEGIQTMELLRQARSELEREQVAVIALLDVEDSPQLELRYHDARVLTGELQAVRQALSERQPAARPLISRCAR